MNIPDMSSEISFSSFPYEIENARMFEEIYSVFPEYAHMALPFAMFNPSNKIEEQFVGKHDLPLTFHSSWHPDDIWANVFDIIKIAEQNSDLRICLAHSGRFSNEALTRADKLQNCFVDTVALKIHCDLAIADDEAVPCREERFETDYSSPAKVLDDLAHAYPDTIMWGSDTPMYSFFRKFDYGGEVIEDRLKANYDDEVSALKGLDAKQKRKVSYENTLHFLFGNKI